MTNLSLATLGRKVRDKRGATGIRATAKEIGLSPSTLSRVENGHLPDVEKLQLICKWLGEDFETLVGSPGAAERTEVAVHFKKQDAVSPETATALANLILAAQRAWRVTEAE